MTFFVDLNSSVAIPFQRLRALMAEQGGGIQEGVANAGDLKVSQRGAGANLSADVAVGAAWIQIDTGSRNGIGHVFSDAVFNAGPFTGGHATLPRVDQVIARWNDSSIPTGTGNTLTIEVLTGTATSGATLDSRIGATALPNDCMRIADVLMPALASSVTTANIRDRRPWARGAYRRILRTQNAAAGSDYTTTSVSNVLIDGTNLQPRIECSGAPLRIMLRTSHFASVTAALAVTFAIDSVSADGGAQFNEVQQTANQYESAGTWVWDTVPAAGSHLIAPFWSITTGTMTFRAQATLPLLFVVEEIVRSSADNT